MLLTLFWIKKCSIGEHYKPLSEEKKQAKEEEKGENTISSNSALVYGNQY